jgi:hypothetical protein
MVSDTATGKFRIAGQSWIGGSSTGFRETL